MRHPLSRFSRVPQWGAVLPALLLSACGGGDTSTPPAQAPKLMASVTASTPVSTDYLVVAQQLYLAYFGRPADPEGLASLEAQLLAANAPTTLHQLEQVYDNNPVVRSLIDSFGASAESTTLYGANTDAQFVVAVYNHMLGRDPLLTGLQYWYTALQSGLPRTKAALAIVAAAQLNTSPQGILDAKTIANKTLGASLYTAAVSAADYRGAAAAAKARNLISAITASLTEDDIKRLIDTGGPIVTPGG